MAERILRLELDCCQYVVQSDLWIPVFFKILLGKCWRSCNLYLPLAVQLKMADKMLGLMGGAVSKDDVHACGSDGKCFSLQ